MTLTRPAGGDAPESQAPAKTPQQIARDEAVRQVVGTLCYIGVVLGISWIITKRDVLWRARRRAELAWKQRNADPYAAQVAEFRREINDLSRGTAGPDTSHAAGLYERGQ
jgi:hypothetical protein